MMLSQLKKIMFHCALALSGIAHAQSAEFLQDLENFQQKSLSIGSEKAKLNSAENYLWSKRLFWTPSLSVSAGRADYKPDTAGSEEPYVQGSATLNLFKGGADWARLEEASALRKSQQMALKNEKLEVEVGAAGLVFKNIYLKEVLRIQSEVLALKEESLRITRSRYSQGKVPLQETRKSEIDLTQQKSRARLASLDVIENEMDTKTQFVEGVKTKKWPFATKISFSPTQERTPQSEEKFWQWKASDQSWRAAHRSYWPTLDFTASYTRFPDLTNDDDQTAYALTLTLPLWSKFETASAVSAAYAQSVEDENAFKTAAQSDAAHQEFLLQKVNITKQNLDDAASNLDKTRSLYRDMLTSFRSGRLSTNDLFIEQNRLLESETAYALSQLTYHQTVVEICAMRGLFVKDCVK